MDRLIAGTCTRPSTACRCCSSPSSSRSRSRGHSHIRVTPATLPSVTCIARFNSDGQLGTDDIWSALRVIWFQDEFAFPIADRAREQIAEIDWETHATGWEP